MVCDICKFCGHLELPAFARTVIIFAIKTNYNVFLVIKCFQFNKRQVSANATKQMRRSL